MSSKAVRDDMVAAWAAKIPSVPFYPTLNLTHNRQNLPDVWATFLYDANRSRITIGSKPSCSREIGVVAAVIMSRAGQGDAVGISIADQIRQQFSDYHGANGYLIILSVQPPNDGVNDTPQKTEYWKTIVEMDYSYDTFD